MKSNVSGANALHPPSSILTITRRSPSLGLSQKTWTSSWYVVPEGPEARMSLLDPNVPEAPRTRASVSALFAPP